MTENSNLIELAVLRFDGPRFHAHALDVECAQELIVYRNIILECARELWRRNNPDCACLPEGFGDGFRLQFDRIEAGSVTVPLCRVREGQSGFLSQDAADEFDEAAELVDAAIAAAREDRLLPEQLPFSVMPLFREFGKSLQDGEILFVKARHSTTEAGYDFMARKRLSEWVRPRDPNAVPIWEQLAAIGRSAPPGTWDNVPSVCVD